jgi:hypothetical protein
MGTVASMAGQESRRDWLIRVGWRSALLTLLVVGCIHATLVFGFDWARPDGDPWNYLAAGERLNDGHPLYAISPGDRPVELRPPWWSVPLLAPPPIAVAWRIPALIGDPSMYIWGALCFAALVGACVYIVRQGGLLAVALLAEPLTLTALSGNFSAPLLAMLVAIWVFRDRPIVVGTIIAIAAAVKLTPVLLVLWLIGTRRWRAVKVVAVVGAAIGLVSLIGAGPQAFADWLRLVPSSRPSPIALATLTGLPAILIPILLAVPVMLAGRRDRLAFGLGVVAVALSSPALYFTAIGLLAAIPFWGVRQRNTISDGRLPDPLPSTGGV